MERLKNFWKNETVLCISAAAAAITMLWNPPGAATVKAIDFRVLALLFCLMAVVAALQRAGVFVHLAQRLAARAQSVRALCAVLVFLCFFTSMLITNDVALLTFVPFAILLLSAAGLKKHLCYTVVLQTLAANLGSMATPVGNPQNLYLFSRYSMKIGAFFAAVLPVTAVSAVILALLLPAIPRGSFTWRGGGAPLKKKEAAAAFLLLAVCLAAVLHWLPWQAMLAAVALWMLIWQRPLWKEIDYGLLATFVCFFIFVGNLGAMEGVRRQMGALLQGREAVAAALLSQGMSNVPAAVLLSGFTENGRALLLGTNIGGLGTPVASLASLISMKLYGKSEGAEKRRFLGLFSLLNFSLLALLLLLFARNG